MPNTYTQIHIHAVFAVQNRNSLISKTWKEELCKYITGILQNNEHKMIAINTMPDHIHVLFGMRPIQSLSDLMRDIKSNSSKWINEKSLTQEKFAWQEGFGAFSYAKSQLPNVIKYIEEQEIHHAKESFLEEYEAFLKAFEIDYNEKYIFKPVE